MLRVQKPVTRWNFNGWRPQRKDPRDMMLRFSHETVAALPPTNARFPQYLPPIWNQLQIGSCTSHGILRCFLYAAAKSGITVPMLSRLMLYFDERQMEQTIESDAGAAIRDGIKSLVSQGVCIESLWPYNISRYRTQPPKEAYDEAKKHLIIKYAAVDPTLGQVKSVLAAGYPVVYGFPVFQSIEDPSVGQTGVIPSQQSVFDPQVGGHCTAFNGFWDDSRQLMGLDNSWDVGWGDQGTGYIPYWYFERGLISDCWVIYNVEAQDLPTPVPVGTDPFVSLKLAGKTYEGTLSLRV